MLRNPLPTTELPLCGAAAACDKLLQQRRLGVYWLLASKPKMEILVKIPASRSAWSLHLCSTRC